MLKEELLNYKCQNEQEENDLKFMLDVIDEDGVFTRENVKYHFTASSFIVNEKMDKVLFGYHNIYKSYGWLGGHADGLIDLAKVSIKEACEEANLTSVRLYSNDIFSLEVIPVYGHIKKGKYVSSHLHLNITYLLIADENQKIANKPDENSDVCWFNLEDSINHVDEKWMVDNVYLKLIKKIKELKSS